MRAQGKGHEKRRDTNGKSIAGSQVDPKEKNMDDFLPPDTKIKDADMFDLPDSRFTK